MRWLVLWIDDIGGGQVVGVHESRIEAESDRDEMRRRNPARRFAVVSFGALAAKPKKAARLTTRAA